MSEIKLKGQVIHTSGELPQAGVQAPDFVLARNDLTNAQLDDYLGSRVILNIFPSLDTGVCAASVRRFNALADSMPGVYVLCISADLPFAQSRFCGAEGLEKVETLSTFRGNAFGADYGVQIIDGPMRGLLARAVAVIEPDGSIGYTQLVDEIASEPDYDEVMDYINQ